MKKAIFLDRDGTLIEDKGYEHSIDTQKVFPRVADGLNLLKGDYLFFIITNQPGIGRGFYTETDFHEFNNHLLQHLNGNGINIEKTYFCPHSDECSCKKPSTKFIDEIVSEYSVCTEESWAIGDHPFDITMGINAGCRTAYLLTGHGRKHFKELKENNISPDIIENSFYSAAKKIKNWNK